MNPLLGGPNEPLPGSGYERALGCQRGVNEQRRSGSGAIFRRETRGVSGSFIGRLSIKRGEGATPSPRTNPPPETPRVPHGAHLSQTQRTIARNVPMKSDTLSEGPVSS